MENFIYLLVLSYVLGNALASTADFTQQIYQPSKFKPAEDFGGTLSC